MPNRIMPLLLAGATVASAWLPSPPAQAQDIKRDSPGAGTVQRYRVEAQEFQERLGVFVACAMPLFVMFIVTDKQRALEQLSLPFLLPLLAALLLWVVVMPYTIVQLVLKIRRLGSPLPG